jgi:hypothetical protein
MTSPARWFRPARTVLLTGAGFTKTFGGFLADEMWALILNQPQIRGHDRLRRKMLEELNYEVLYHDILNAPDGDDAERQAFVAAVRRAYEQLHAEIFDPQRRDRSCSACVYFLARFVTNEYQERSFVFTLNQDLFVENFYSTSDHLIKLPGLHNDAWFQWKLAPSLQEGMFVELPSGSLVDEIKRRFWDKSQERLVYIKLHGSYDWRLSNRADLMVLGRAKSQLIQSHPLLSWYFSLFEEVLQAGARNLVVIGYGFRDEHINNVIADAIRDHRLRLFVVSPESPAQFRYRIAPDQAWNLGVPRSQELWEGLSGYYRADVTELYRPGMRDLPPRGEAFFRDLGLR